MTDYPKPLNHLLSILDEMQAFDVTVIDVKNHTPITDYMIIASGRSSRHIKSVGQTAVEKMKNFGTRSLSCHGMEDGEWVLVDFGDYVLHLMQTTTRAFYNLEGLWQEQ